MTFTHSIVFIFALLGSAFSLFGEEPSVFGLAMLSSRPTSAGASEALSVSEGVTAPLYADADTKKLPRLKQRPPASRVDSKKGALNARQPVRKKPVEPVVESDSLIENGIKIIAGVCLTLILLFTLNSPSKKSQTETSSAPPTESRHRTTKPLVLSHRGIDPATMQQSGLIRINSFKSNIKSRISAKLAGYSKENQKSHSKISFGEPHSSHPELRDPFAEAVSLFGPQNSSQNRAIAKEISSITHLASDLGFASAKDEKASKPHEQRESDGKAPFPPALADHFEPQSREKLLWHRTYRQGANEGTMAITSQRVLHIYRRRIVRILPPGIDVVVEKNQHPLLSLRTVRRRQARKNFLIIAAAPFVFWFPVGTLIAAALLIAYGLWTSDEIAIGVNPERLKSYPLPEATQIEFQAIFKKVRSRQVVARKSSSKRNAS